MRVHRGSLIILAAVNRNLEYPDMREDKKLRWETEIWMRTRESKESVLSVIGAHILFSAVCLCLG